MPPSSEAGGLQSTQAKPTTESTAPVDRKPTIDFSCSFQSTFDIRPGCRRHGAGASISGIGRSVRRLGCSFAGKLFIAAAAVAEESKNLGPFRCTTRLSMELLVRIVLSNCNELWQVRILLPRPLCLRFATADRKFRRRIGID
jgi:hypothetical protein